MILGNFIKDNFNEVEKFEEVDDFGNETYWFKALDVERVLKVSYLRVIIKNYNENEKMVRNTKKGAGNQETLYLSSRGLYRVLYNVKSEKGSIFRSKIGEMLDSIFFEKKEEKKAMKKVKGEDMSDFVDRLMG